MSLAETLIVAVALAMDAFAVSVGVGVQLRGASGRQTFRMAWHFGLFQALMPILGWAAGTTLREYIESLDHWIAFALLAFIGGRMVLESIRDGEEDERRGDPTQGMTLVLLSTATSIDALGVGLSLAFLQISVWLPAVVIGVVALVATAFGIHLGAWAGRSFPVARYAGMAGGVLLVGIGIRILAQHGALG